MIDLKQILIAAVCLNFIIGVILYVQLDISNLVYLQQASFSGNSKDESDYAPWMLSEAYEDYLRNNRFNSDIEEQIVHDPFYCQKHKEYTKTFKLQLDKQGIPLKKYRIIFSDYLSGNLVKEVARKRATLVLHDHDIKTDVDSTPMEPVPLNVTLFYHKSYDWHKYYEIGKEWLCPGQRYNHIPGHESLSYKDSVVDALREYGSAFLDRKHCFDPWQFIPLTYNLNNKEECSEFFRQLQNVTDFSQIQWIMKKSRDSHNSSGIKLLDNENAKLFKRKYENGKACYRSNSGKYIAQKYISNPLLINKRKFDFRVYMLIANMDPLIVLYHDGFLRVTAADYDPLSSDQSIHLTNTELVKKALKTANMTETEKQKQMDEQMWTMHKFEDYMVNEGLVQENWLNDYVRPLMKRHILHLTRATIDKLLRHPGVFELYGADFLFDSDLNLWFIEMNKSPAMQATTIEKGILQSKLIEDVFNIEYALMFNANVDEIIEQSGFEYVIDERKPGQAKYMGLIINECL